jgi:hypothetical protein
MTTPIGYATLQLIPSLRGVSEAVDKQLDGALSGPGKRAGAKLGKGIAEGIKASEADVKRAFDAHAKLADKAADSTGKLKVAQAGLQDVIDKGVTSGKRFEQAIEARDKALREETRAAKTASDAFKEYERAAKSAAESGGKVSSGVTSSLRGLGSEVRSAGSDAAGSFVAGFGGATALTRLGAAGGPIGLALTAAGAVGGGLLVKGIMAGLEREPLRDKIQAQLGIDEAAMARLGTAASAAFANNFGASRDEAFDAARRAAQGGLIDPSATEAELRPVVEQLLSLNQLIDGDLTNTTKAASVLLRSGLAASATEAFDIIAAGYTKLGGDLGGDLMDSLGEYSSGWKNAGLSAEQALALINQSIQMGVDNTDRGADALREFGRRVSEEGPKIVAVLDNIGLNGEATFDKFKQGGPAAFQAFDQVFDTIRGIEDPVRRNQAAMALLGDTAGDFIGTFAQWDPSKAVADFGSVEGAAQAASDTMGTSVVGSFESAKRTIGVAVDEIQDDLAAAFGPGLKQLADSVVAHKDQITAAFGAVATSVTSASLSVLDDVGLTLQAFSRLIGGVGNVYGTITRAHAAAQRLLGHGEIADQLDKDADAAFGWGEDLYASGEELRKLSEKGGGFIDKLKAIGHGTKDAGKGTAGLGDDVARLGTKADTTGGKLDALRDKIADMPAGSAGWFGSPAAAQPGGALGALGTVTAEEASRLGGASINTSILTSLRGTNPGAKLISGMTDHSQDSGEHPKGKAIDVDPSRENLAWAWANRDKLSMIIYDDPNYVWYNMHGERAEGAAARRIYGESTMKQHGDHIHLAALSEVGRTSPSGSLSALADTATAGGKVPDWDAIAANESGTPGQAGTGRWNLPSGDRDSTGGLQIRQGTWNDFGGQRYAPSPWQASKEQQIAVAEKILAKQGPNAWAGGKTFAWKAGSQLPGLADMPTYPSQSLSLGANTTGGLVNAFGADFKPGIGTPGYDEYGEPGYYRVDPKEVRNAQRRAEDAQQAIADADERIAAAKAKQAEAEEDIYGTAKTRAQAARDVAQAERSAADAREGASDAVEAAAEAAKGRFTRATKSEKGSGSGFGFPSLTNFSGIGSALGEFAGGQIGSALDVFGVGDSPGWLQGIGQFIGGISIGGGGSSFGGAAPLSAAGAMGGAPPMPSGAMHGGTGGRPGPVFNTNIQVRDAEGAMAEWQRWQDRVSSAKLDHL